MRWLEVAVTTSGEMAETVAAVLHRHCSGGVALEPAFNPDDDQDGSFEEVPDGLATVRGYLAMDAAVVANRQAIEVAIWHLRQLLPDAPVRLAFDEVREEDWATAWKAHYHALTVGRFLIVPAWEEPTQHNGDLVIRLDPGMAFGTGVHASTQLMLHGIERVIRTKMLVADVGAGSGILAIASALLGASRVAAVDLDSVAVESARSNVDLNGLSDRVRVYEGSVGQVPSDAYDVVLANIVAAVIAELMPELKRLLAQGGVLLTSGIIAEREHLVLEAARLHGLVVAYRQQRDDWVCLELRVT